jgi:hypothetical protein
MDVKTPFKITDLPKGWGVSWPGFEYNVVNNPRKATTLLKILFDDVGVDCAKLAVTPDQDHNKSFTLELDWIAYHQNPDHAGEFLTRQQSVTGCLFDTKEQAEKFKLIMDQRLAWRRLGGAWK